MPTDPARDSSDAPEAADLRRRHVRLGWWALLIFLAFGIVLEAFHAFKTRSYLGVDVETRRLMWTLAHAHGTLLALVNLAFGLAVAQMPRLVGGSRQLASRALLAASGLLPLGFLLGGISVEGGDPGVGIVLVPLGAALLLLAILIAALRS